MLRLIPLAVVIAVAGCAAKVLDSNERTVIVHSVSANPKDAFALANPECAKHGRYARLKIKPDDDRQWVFDCVQ